MRTIRILGVILNIVILYSCALALDYSTSGQIVLTEKILPEKPFYSSTMLRFVPELSAWQSIGDESLLDMEVSLDSRIGYNYRHPDGKKYDGLDLYRAWLRYTTPQLELRVGLQKINFGTAMYLRPLQWFDRIDPRDPQKMTDGVYAFLTRYYFLDNSNIWLWCLMENEDLKGTEMIKSDKDMPEIGGRIQIPFLTGEAGLSYHQRRVALKDFARQYIPQSMGINVEDYNEYRAGFDLRLDYTCGMWLEGALIYHDFHIPDIIFINNLKKLRYQRALCIGIDYTIDIGDGITAAHEFYNLETAEELFEGGESLSMSALSLRYPYGLYDSFFLLFNMDWENEEGYAYISWEQVYDYFTFNLALFFNPDNPAAAKGTTGAVSSNSGKGFQFSVQYNF